MQQFDEVIREKAEQIAPELVACRRDLHKYAEVGWTEFRTASKVIRRLRKLGYEVHFGSEVVEAEAQMGVPDEKTLQACMKRAIDEGADPDLVRQMAGGRTGVVGILRTGKTGKTVALRFDMDCLPLDEATEEKHRPFKEGFASVHPHCMHACGHDGHTTVGLGVAEVLMGMKDQLTGTVKLVFQPAEEGVRGAKAMAAAGVVDDVDYLLASHVMPPKLGVLAYDVRGFLATTKFNVDFRGVSVHAGAMPEQGKNALLAAVTATANMAAIARHSGGVTRLNVGVLQSGTTRNAIPDKAHLEIETRGATTELDQYMFQRAKTIIEAAAAMYEVEAKITLVGGSAAGNSDAELADKVRDVAERLGIFDKFVKENPGGSEDCAYLMERVQQHGGKAAYITLGGSLAAPNHNEYFDFDESFMTKDVILLSAATCELLRQ